MIQLKKKYECKEIIDELDELIKESVNLYDDFKTCKVSDANVKRINLFETIILDHLLDKTNFERILILLKLAMAM